MGPRVLMRSPDRPTASSCELQIGPSVYGRHMGPRVLMRSPDRTDRLLLRTPDRTDCVLLAATAVGQVSPGTTADVSVLTVV
jgi:hypothetical protein